MLFLSLYAGVDLAESYATSGLKLKQAQCILLTADNGFSCNFWGGSGINTRLICIQIRRTSRALTILTVLLAVVVSLLKSYLIR
ncbi:MAG: hypothetical protein ABS24_07875 [SAR92 bacterium BACL26 MAG-121220-bin70]|uniref:Uncharacterized protein n=1 Tax=SAR92 bacterium BACL26 MAG-121220-bin70 TaxID=1655626 RepID=A0A0R2TVX3_9GAMM|nr:MAG: hypothetical protein ABS24_07875 [SAR92 bacterium BACL26 MAG-121220-bin70]